MAADVKDEKVHLRELNEEVRRSVTDQIKESTVEYYLNKKDKVGSFAG